MKSTQISYIFLAVIGILMYNVFLIQRDEKLFKSYYVEKAKAERLSSMTPKERFCASQAHWHPDCNLE